MFFRMEKFYIKSIQNPLLQVYLELYVVYTAGKKIVFMECHSTSFIKLLTMEKKEYYMEGYGISARNRKCQ